MIALYLQILNDRRGDSSNLGEALREKPVPLMLIEYDDIPAGESGLGRFALSIDVI